MFTEDGNQSMHLKAQIYPPKQSIKRQMWVETVFQPPWLV
jgi:hypothetical protein